MEDGVLCIDPETLAYVRWVKAEIAHQPQWKQDLWKPECCRGVVEVGNVCRAKGRKVVVIMTATSSGPCQYSGHLIGQPTQEWSGTEVDKLAQSERQYRKLYFCPVHGKPYTGGIFGLNGRCAACEEDPAVCPHDLTDYVGADIWCKRCGTRLNSGGDYSWWPPA